MSEESSAFVPVGAEPQEKRYLVSGEQAVLGHAPGETFVATFNPQQEEYYIQFGHLQVVSESTPSTPSEEEEETAEAPVEGEQKEQTSEEQE